MTASCMHYWQLQQSAAALLLRSPRFTVTQVMDLLDISDAEFRELIQVNDEISTLLEARRRGELVAEEPDCQQTDWCGFCRFVRPIHIALRGSGCRGYNNRR